ncbi:MAG: SMC-Scp complex subunit ScpB [Clostridia bacterium]|nr:SMC-Scp complex subunit ScpB [Clostridia bacterium]
MEELQQLTEIKKIEGAIDAILFAAGHPVEYSKLAETLGMSTRDAKRITEHMADARNSDATSGIMMALFDDSCQLCTREDYYPWVREALGIKRGGNLSPSALEVLSVVAYNQPVTRAFIDKIRNVDSAYAVGSLIDKELITAVGRLDAPGRPMLYGTTEKFLRVFGLSSISELPEAGSIEAAISSLTETGEEAGEEAGTAGDGSADESGDTPDGEDTLPGES